MNSLKKLLPALFSVLMLIAIIPINAAAVEMPVSTCQQLSDALNSQTSDRTIRLLNDIPLCNWTPIDISNSSQAKFTLDGDGYTLTFSANRAPYVGLFGSVGGNADIKIKDLGLNIAGVTANSTSYQQLYAGGLIGVLNSGKVSIENSYVTGVSGGQIYAARERTGSFTDVHSGGFFGEIRNGTTVTITDSFANIPITARALSSGKGNVPTSYAGGFVGKNVGGTLNITRSYTAGSVYVYVDTNYGETWFTTRLNGEAFGGGLVGYVDTLGEVNIIGNSVAWLSDMVTFDGDDRSPSPNNGYGIELTSAQLKNSGTSPIKNWLTQFPHIWILKSDKNNGYPSLRHLQVKLELVEDRQVWSQPRIVAALAAPPYFKALPNNNYTNSSTSYKKTTGTGDGTTESHQTTVGGFVSVDVEIPTFWPGVKVAIEGEKVWSDVDGVEKEVTKTISYSTGYETKDRNYVVVMEALLHSFLYTATYQPDDYDCGGDVKIEGGVCKIDVTVVVPYDSAPKVRVYPLEGYVNGSGTYVQGYEDLRNPVNALPDLSNILTNKPGYPESYLSVAPQVAGNITEVLIGESATFPHTEISANSEIVIEKTNQTIISTGVSIENKFGGGVSFKGVGKIVGGYAGSKDDMAGTIVIDVSGTTYTGTVYGQDDSIGDGFATFDFQLLRIMYNHNDPDNPQEFPVITYVIPESSIKQPAGAIPASKPIVTILNPEMPQTSPHPDDPPEKISGSVTAGGVNKPTRIELLGAPFGMDMLDMPTTGKPAGWSNFIANDPETFTIAINKYVNPGVYDKLHLEVGGVPSNEFSITVKERDISPFLQAEPDNVVFPSAIFSYSGAYDRPAARQITIRNIGSRQMYGVRATLIGSPNSAFEITEELSANSLGAGASAFISVRPKTGLRPGTYTDVLYVTDNDSRAEVKLSFTLHPPNDDIINVSTFAELSNVMAYYRDAVRDMDVSIAGGFSITAPLTIPANANGAALILRSADAANPAILIRGGYAGTLITVSSGAKLILEDIIIDGNKDVYPDKTGRPGINIDGGELVMNGGVIRRNSTTLDNSSAFDSTSSSSGGVYVTNNGRFTMTGGTICENFAANKSSSSLAASTSSSGGGVYVSNGTFTMSGGEISHNKAESSSSSGLFFASTSSSGGGVYVSNGTFTMTGGEIGNNSAMSSASGIGANSSTSGGGVYVGRGSRFNVGGKAVVSDNINNNVYLPNRGYITLGRGDDAPDKGMSVGIQTETTSGVIVDSGANPGDEQYFHADESRKVVVFRDNQLVIEVASINTVTYNLNGGTGTIPTETPKMAGTTFASAQITGITAPSDLLRFREWNTQQNGTGRSYQPGNAVTMPNEALILYAIWENIPPSINTVTYNLNGGTGTTPTETPKETGATFAAAQITGITPPYGKRFKEWNTAQNGAGTTYYPGNAVTMPNTALVLYAIWEEIQSGPVYVSTLEELQMAISDFDYTPDDTAITVTAGFDITDGLSIPANAYGAALVIASADPANPVTLTRGVTGCLFIVNTDVKMELENIIIDGNKDNPAFFNNTSPPFSDNTSSLVCVKGGEFTMKPDAVLRNNRSSNGGGVYVDTGTFAMTDGEISGNSADNNGGGVYVGDSGTFTMTDGEISGNSAGTYGGGVYTWNDGTFTMKDGKISGNTSDFFGGGVYVNSATFTFTMTGGEIVSNTATVSLGGGVFGNSKIGGKAIIIDNRNGSNASSNVYLPDGTQITLLTDIPPTSEMNIGVLTATPSGVIVPGGCSAISSFHADEPGKVVTCVGSDLVIASVITDYLVTVSSAGSGATGGGYYAPGATVSICAGTPPTGMRFKNWTSSPAVTFANANSSCTTFTMPGVPLTLMANFEPIPVTTYTVTVSSAGAGASGGGNYATDEIVSISAGTAPAGQRFNNWTASPGVSFANANSANTTFKMPANAVTVTANFVTTPPPVTYYAVTVSSAGTGATGGGNYTAGANVSISAGTPPAGQRFKNWTASPGVSFANASSPNTTFTMPSNAVTVTANFEPEVQISEESILITGMRPGFQVGLARYDSSWVYAQGVYGYPDVEFPVEAGDGPFMLWIGLPDFPALMLDNIYPGTTIDVSVYFYDVAVPEGVSHVGISSFEGAVYGDFSEGDVITLLKTGDEWVLVFDSDGVYYEKTFVADGSNPFPGEEPGVEPVVTVPSATVEKLGGGKERLTISLTEALSDGSTVTGTVAVTINENTAGYYTVGSYLIYVDALGSGSIRRCYIVNRD